MKRAIVTLTLAVATLLVANTPPSAKRVPPQEAISICSGKSEKSSCTVTTPQGDSLEGSCQNTPDDKYFACIPKNHKPQRK